MSQEVAIMKCSKEKTEDWKELLLKDFRLKITAFSETGDLTFLNETKTENVYLKNWTNAKGNVPVQLREQILSQS